MKSASQRIPIIKRQALWHAHNKRCAYCREPLSFGDLCVDHIIPQGLGNQPDELAKILSDLELCDDFDLFDYGNWAPSHARCNLQKGKTVLERGAAQFFLAIASDKSQAAREKEESLTIALKPDRLKADLLLGIEQGLIQKSEIIRILETAPVEVQSDTDPLVISFGANIYELSDTEALPADAPSDQPALYDWLERLLQEHIESIVSSPFFYTEPSQRTGETISVRIGILDSDIDEIEQISPKYWELMDLGTYSNIYKIWLSASDDDDA
jgi:hypothetical protein